VFTYSIYKHEFELEDYLKHVLLVSYVMIILFGIDYKRRVFV